jgi:hypothetical protein
MENTIQTPSPSDLYIPNFKDWLINVIVASIPVVGLVLLIIWALEKDPRYQIRKNWSSAMLVWQLIVLVLCLLMWFVFFAFFMAATSTQSQGTVIYSN